MNLKKLLKTLKLNESTISMILGAIVIIIIGTLVINYFSKKETGETIPSIGTEGSEIVLPTTYTVVKGDDLWKISEKYYKSGYNWKDIANANKLSNPGILNEGTKLVIPDVTPKLISQAQEPSVTPSVIKVETVINEITPTIESQSSKSAISGDSYTVVKGDNLWKIAIRAYGDGYKWVNIANANKLKNPSIIHSGNVFVIPR